MKQHIRIGAALALATLLAGCAGGAGPQTDSSPDKSSDSLLKVAFDAFRRDCIATAPDFTGPGSDLPPPLPPDMTYIAFIDETGSCMVTVHGYGEGRALPRMGDINDLGASLQSRVGGALRPGGPDTGSSSAQVRNGFTVYNIYAYVTDWGDLQISVAR